MNEKSISEHARPWQQMLMFFARTQREHAWRSPKYQFTRQQREVWEALVKEAERSVKREEEGQGANDEEMDDEEIDNEEMENEEMADDVNEAIEEMETEGNRTAEGISEPESLSNIQKACLTCQHGTSVHKVHVNCISHVTLSHLLTHLGCVYNRSL
jgi:hypothetical protein